MNSRLTIARHPGDLAAILKPMREKSQRIGFVPTMGALHEGHLSLIDFAKSRADVVVASIFVNPKQFAPSEDLSTYPRDEDQDLQMLDARACDIVYMPSVEVMYPQGYQTGIFVPELAKPLDGASRGPGYFGGIATVVAKLFNQVRPDCAIFGEKDYQQLLVIRQMALDLNFDLEVLGAPIIRESDGLAMSSRNRYLSDDERAIAARLNVVMRKTNEKARADGQLDKAVSWGKSALEEEGLSPFDYLSYYSVPDLQPASCIGQDQQANNLRLFAAVMLGRTRLIDNMALTE